MNDGHMVSPGLKTNDLRETGVATTHGLDRSNGPKKNGRTPSDSKDRTQTPVDQRSIVAGQFMRMSTAHDRIRIKLLAANLLRVR
jgi:hypothetical protein